MSYYHYSGDQQIARLAHDLDRHPDYRVLRRLPEPGELWLSPTPCGGAATTLAVIDTETTGLDPERDALIELAIVRMQLDTAGLLIDVEPPVTMLEEPPAPIPPAVEALTGITDQMVGSLRFDEVGLRRLLCEVDVVVCHHAAFDRGFLVRRFPWLDRPWACTVKDIDWREFGLEGRALGHLLASAGHFMSRGHRAGEDAWALACLLAHVAPDDRPIAAHLVEAARRPGRRLLARHAPMGTRVALKAAGYRWDPVRRVWWIAGDEERIVAENAFLRSLHPLIQPETEVVDWFTRHAG